MRVLVCGGRDYKDYHTVAVYLNQCLPSRPTTIIEGGAHGADELARKWARVAEVPVETYVANWKLLGPKAGPIRNQAMLDQGKPDIVVAFPGGRGTADMVRRARAANIPVREVMVMV